MSDARRALGGTAWVSLAHLAQQAVFLIALTRLLRPEDFGLFAIVAAVAGFASLLAEQGLGVALVQRTGATEAHLHSVFWYSLLLGVAFAGAFAALAPVVGGIYGDARLTWIGRALAPTFVLNALTVVPRAVLQRRLAIERLAAIDLLCAAVAGGVAVVGAVRGWGAWSLVAQALVLAAATAAALGLSARWLPRLRFDWRGFRGLLGYGGNLLGSNLVTYWARNADSLVVGKLVGSAGLGLYSRAYSLVFMPVTQLNMLLGKALFPILCALQDDAERARRVYLRAAAVLVLVAAPLLLGLFASAEAFVRTAFGDSWLGMVGVLRLLALAALVQTLYLPMPWIYASAGRTDLLLRWGAMNSAALLLGIAAGALRGTAVSVAVGYLVANLLVLYPAVRLPARQLGLRVTQLVRACSGALGCAVVMSGAVALVPRLLPAGPEPWAVLALQVATGAAVYLALLTAFSVSSYGDLASLLLGRRAGATDGLAWSPGREER